MSKGVWRQSKHDEFKVAKLGWSERRRGEMSLLFEEKRDVEEVMRIRDLREKRRIKREKGGKTVVKSCQLLACLLSFTSRASLLPH